MTPISKPQADALASLAVTLRPDGSPWDAAGVLAAVGKVRDSRDRDSIIRAVLALAVDARVRTPAVLAHDGPHWTHQVAAGVEPPVRRPTPMPPQVVVTPRRRVPVEVTARRAAACREALKGAGT